MTIVVGWDMQVGVNYDPMIAKIIARGPDRQTALRKMYTALLELQVWSLIWLMCACLLYPLPVLQTDLASPIVHQMIS